MGATKRMARAAHPAARKRTPAALARPVLQLEADDVGDFVRALRPGTTEEFQENLWDLIVLEQRKDEKGGSLACEVFAELERKRHRS